jgi:protein-disulfide isomerase
VHRPGAEAGLSKPIGVVQTATMTEEARLRPVGPRDHIRGRDGAAVTLIEYGDFECPHCRAAYPYLAELERKYGGDLRFVFRHFPITTAHPHAQAAAEASEWAAAQGKFWAWHDALYQDPDRLGEANLIELAGELGLDGQDLRRALAAHTFLARVKEDFLEAIKVGVKGTPAFFLDGVRVSSDDLAGAVSDRVASLPGPAPPGPGAAPPR